MNIGQLSSQIVLMFCLMLVGVLINRLHFMSAQTSSDLTNILLYIVSPCLIVQAFEQPYSGSRIEQFLLTGVGVLIAYVVYILIAKFTFRKVSDHNLKRTSMYGSIFSNAGFMGVPLASSLFGNTGVFFAVVSLAGFNIFNWTYGVSLFKKDPQDNNWRDGLKSALLNPNIIAIVVGFIMFVCSFRFPSILNKTVSYVSSINTPLSMIVIGNSLANASFKKKDLSEPLWLALTLRNLIFPIIAIFILKFVGVKDVALMTTILMFACPTAGIVVLFTLQAHGNTAPGIALMSISTVISIATIPLVFLLNSLPL